MSTTRKLQFSGKDDDWGYFAEQFEARMYGLKLLDVLNNEVETPIKPETESGEERALRLSEEEKLATRRYEVWIELVQCLDKKSTMYIRAYKPDGVQAWNALKERFRSTELPRIQSLMTQLTNLKMQHNETISDYFLRAEDLKIDLEQVHESVSESMFTAMILKGLTKEFEPMATLIKYGETKPYFRFKQDLLKFRD